MGLDLTLYSMNFEYNNDIWRNEEKYEKLQELCYGRKTWAIAEFFMRRCKEIDECVYEVDEIAWIDFFESVRPVVENKELMDILDRWSKNEDDITEEEYSAFEKALDDALVNDDIYSLGVDWEGRAVVRWYEADEKVREAFNNGNTLILSVSF